MYASYSKLSKDLKYSNEILVGQAVFKLWIKGKGKVETEAQGSRP